MKDFEVLKTLVATNAHTDVAITTRPIIKKQLSDGYHGSCLTDAKQVLTIRDLTTVLRSGTKEREKREAVSCFCFSINKITRNSVYFVSCLLPPSSSFTSTVSWRRCLPSIVNQNDHSFLCHSVMWSLIL